MSDTYSSLAMCSSCSDISNTVKNDTTTNSDGFSTSSGCHIDDVNFGNAIYVLDDEGNTDQPLAVIDTLMYRNSQQGSSEKAIRSTPLGGLPSPLAVRCTLKPCINTYVGNVTNGVLEETKISTTPLPFIDGGIIGYYAVIFDSIKRDGQTPNCTPVTSKVNNSYTCSTPGYTPYNITATEPQCWLDDCIWSFGVDPTGGIPGALVRSILP
jgi:hypothetical protein